MWYHWLTTEGETMQDIPQWERLYAAATDGKIWSHPKTVTVGINGGSYQRPGQWLTQTPPTKRTKHLRVYLARNGKKTPFLVHRLIALTFIPNPESLPIINHIDGNPANNNVSNLEWCSYRHNAVHAYNSGLTLLPNQRGENNSNSTLTEATVIEMRNAFDGGLSSAAVARQFGIQPKTAYDAIHGRRWGHVKRP
jgi:hypothetical protein